jgi:type II secretory pathway component PulJ
LRGRSDRAPNCESGFTLIEALAALLLLSAVVVLFGATLRLELKVGEAGRTREQLLAFNAGIDAISHLLSRALPVRETADEQQQRIIFNGQRDHITFITLSEGTIQPGGLLAASIKYRSLSSEIGEISIETESIPVGDTRPAFQRRQATPTTLLAKIHGARFRYFGTKMAGQSPQWYDQWNGEIQLPQLVIMNFLVRVRGYPQELEFAYRLPVG